MGWVTTAAYFVAAMLALAVAVRVKHLSWEKNEQRNRIFWLLLMLLLIFLGLNKQLDLQSYITAVGKCAANLGGWYEERHQWKVVFILSIGGLFVFVGLFLLWYFRGNMTHNWWAIVGIVFLMSFVLIRASSFDDYGAFLNYELNGFRINWALELSGILLICIQSVINLRIEKKYILDHPGE